MFPIPYNSPSFNVCKQNPISCTKGHETNPLSNPTSCSTGFETGCKLVIFFLQVWSEALHVEISLVLDMSSARDSIKSGQQKQVNPNP